LTPAPSRQHAVFKTNECARSDARLRRSRLINQYAVKTIRASRPYDGQRRWLTHGDRPGACERFTSASLITAAGRDITLAQQVANLGIEVLTGHAVCEAASGSDGVLREVAIYPSTSMASLRSTARGIFGATGGSQRCWAPTATCWRRSAASFASGEIEPDCRPMYLPAFCGGSSQRLFSDRSTLGRRSRAGLGSCHTGSLRVEIFFVPPRRLRGAQSDHQSSPVYNSSPTVTSTSRPSWPDTGEI